MTDRLHGGRDFESAFSVVLDRAANFGEGVHAAVASLHPPDTTLDHMPESTVWRLHLTATASYEAAVQCLRTRYTSVGGYILLRGLLEAWAHLDFIADESQSGSGALRAVRFELGAHQEWEESSHDAPGGHPSPLIANDNQQAMSELWQQQGGKGSPALRGRKHVQATLTHIATREGFDWLRGLYRSTSAAAHMFGVNFLLEDHAGTTAVVWATSAQRCSWFGLEHGLLRAAEPNGCRPHGRLRTGRNGAGVQQGGARHHGRSSRTGPVGTVRAAIPTA